MLYSAYNLPSPGPQQYPSNNYNNYSSNFNNKNNYNNNNYKQDFKMIVAVVVLSGISNLWKCRITFNKLLFFV